MFGKTSFVTILFVFQHFVKEKFCVILTLRLQGLTGFQHQLSFFIADWNNTPSNIMHAPSLSSFMSHLLDHECKFHIRCNLRVRSMQFNYYQLWDQLKSYFLTLALRRTREGGGGGGWLDITPSEVFCWDFSQTIKHQHLIFSVAVRLSLIRS